MSLTYQVQEKSSFLITIRQDTIHIKIQFMSSLTFLCLDSFCFNQYIYLILGERVDTSIFCSSAIKSNRSISEQTQPHICVTPYTEQIKDIQSENQAIDNVRSMKNNSSFF
jgi:hypothetical protein